MIYMDMTSRRKVGFRFGDLRVLSLLFEDNGFLLSSSGSDQKTLCKFAANCEASEMKVSTSKHDANFSAIQQSVAFSWGMSPNLM